MPKRVDYHPGQVIGNGFRVLDGTRYKVGNTHKMQVQCPLCGDNFFLNIRNASLQSSCGCAHPATWGKANRKLPGEAMPLAEAKQQRPVRREPLEVIKLPEDVSRRYEPLVTAFLLELELDPVRVIEDLSKEYWQLQTSGRFAYKNKAPSDS